MQNDEGKYQKRERGSREGTNGTHLTPSLSPQSGEGGVRNARQIPAWWLDVPEVEKAVIRDVLTSIRGLKGSRSPLVGQAARKWERSIACFIKFRLMGGASQWQRHRPKAEMLKTEIRNGNRT